MSYRLSSLHLCVLCVALVQAALPLLECFAADASSVRYVGDFDNLSDYCSPPPLDIRYSAPQMILEPPHILDSDSANSVLHDSAEKTYPAGPSNPDGGVEMQKAWNEWTTNVRWAVIRKAIRLHVSRNRVCYVTFDMTKERHLIDVKASLTPPDEKAELEIVQVLRSMDGDKIFDFPPGSKACRKSVNATFFGLLYDPDVADFNDNY